MSGLPARRANIAVACFVVSIFLFVMLANFHEPFGQHLVRVMGNGVSSNSETSTTPDPRDVHDDEEEETRCQERKTDEQSLIAPLPNVTRIIYNRVPKCGSTSVRSIMRKIALPNHFNWRVYYKFTTFSLPEDQLKKKIKEILAFRTPLVYDGHIHYINFTKYNRSVEQPAYVNVIRDPLERMASWYYFIRWDHKRVMDDTRRNRTFDKCVEMKLEECVSVSNYFTIAPFFCGQEDFCREPSERSLQQAKYNVENLFAVVGVTDDLKSFFRVLEYRFPQFFGGIERTFMTKQEALWRVSQSSRKRPVEFRTRQALQHLLKYDNDFYYFVKQRFYKQLQQLDSKLYPIETP